MADNTGIWEAIKGLLMGQPQSTNPQVQNLAQAGFPGAQQMTQRQGGLFGQGGPFGQPGSLMQAIAAPLAIFSAVEAARGKGVGSAYLGGLGDLLGGLGEQRQKWAEDTDTSEALLKEVNAQFPQFANNKGLQETVKGFINTNPTEAFKNIEGLQKHLEGLKTPREPIPGALNAASMAVNQGRTYDQLKTDADRQKAYKFQQQMQTDPKMQIMAKQQQDALARQNQSEAFRWQTLLQMEASTRANMMTMMAYHEKMADARDDKEKANAQQRVVLEHRRRLDELNKEAQSIQVKAKDPNFKQDDLQALTDAYNAHVDSVESDIKDDIGGGYLPYNFNYKRPQRLNVGPIRGPLGGKIPFFNTHGVVGPEATTTKPPTAPTGVSGSY